MRPVRSKAPVRSSLAMTLLRAAAMVAIPLLLVAGVIGGLLRAGVPVPLPDQGRWPGQAVLAHAFLMICAFLGTAIGLERAVAVKARPAFAAPACSALAGVLMLAGAATAAAWLTVLASFIFLAVNALIVERQRATHTRVLLAGAFAWFVGNLLLAFGAPTAAIVPWWLSFLVLTIAAERLEMTRLMRQHPGATVPLLACLGALILGCALFTIAPSIGGIVYGLALLGLSAWLARHDIARRTVAAHGLSRYMAVCLLLGYAWLAVAGLAWMAGAWGYPARDIALHAVGLGFVFSMMFAHAPVILPALTRVKILFSAVLYVPLGLLHLSLALRLFLGPADFRLLGAGATGNALAIALFATTLLGCAAAWRFQTVDSKGHENAARAPE